MTRTYELKKSVLSAENVRSLLTRIASIVSNVLAILTSPHG